MDQSILKRTHTKRLDKKQQETQWWRHSKPSRFRCVKPTALWIRHSIPQTFCFPFLLTAVSLSAHKSYTLVFVIYPTGFRVYSIFIKSYQIRKIDVGHSCSEGGGFFGFHLKSLPELLTINRIFTHILCVCLCHVQHVNNTSVIQLF